MKEKTLQMALTGIFIFACTVFFSNPADYAGNDKNTYAYINLTEAAANKTPYLGDVSKVDAIISLLPPLSEFHDQRFISLDTETPPYGLHLYYGYNGNTAGTRNPYITSQAENNALILFTFIDNLEYIYFAFNDNLSDDDTLVPSNYVDRYIYTRADFTSRFGDLEPYQENLKALDQLLAENYQIDSDCIHYNRIRLDDTIAHVLYRNGDPNNILYRADGSVLAAIYEDGALQIAFDENGQIEAMHIQGNSEILMNCSMEDGTYTSMTGRLGTPFQEDITGESLTAYYRIKQEEEQYVYFRFLGNKLTEHGVISGKIQ